MVIHGGYGVNSTEFFTDLWLFDFSISRWIMLYRSLPPAPALPPPLPPPHHICFALSYGEWYNSQGKVSPMLDYAGAAISLIQNSNRKQLKHAVKL